MAWKRSVNEALGRATGFEVRRTGSRERGPSVGEAPSGERLVRRPVFIMCTLRSGSTLLRVLLNSHSCLHAPHELHLGQLAVNIERRQGRRAMEELGLDEQGLRFLLWDRVLHRVLASSGKPTLVEKTPGNIFRADSIRECWPDARFLFLLRHPAAIARSRLSLRPELDPEENLQMIRRYCRTLERARRRHPGHTLRYEELTREPERVLRGACEFLEIPFEREMLDYGEHEHGRFDRWLGDWAEKIRTGRIQPADPPPAETPEPLREIAERWGYAEAPAGRS